MYYYQTPSSPTVHDHLHHGPKRPSFIEVVGEGSISVVPNQAEVILGVITESENVSDAQQQNALVTASVIQSIQQLNIPTENIQTSDYRIIPQYHFDEGNQTLIGYRVEHHLKIDIDMIEKTGIVIDTAVQQGANSVTSISFRVKHPERYYNQALQVALSNGTEKAKTIASHFGTTLNPIPFEVTEFSMMPYQTRQMTMMFAEAQATPIQPGRQQITATVRMKFRYIN